MALRRVPVLFLLRLALAAAVALAAPACAKQIGDSCQTGTECSINGDRQCDTTQPGGYCTVINCDSNGCPDNARCVEFISNVARRARRYCVKSCQKTSDCRSGYVCEPPPQSPDHVVVYAPDACAPADDAAGSVEGAAVNCNAVLDTDGGVRDRPGYCVPAASGL